MKKKRYITSIKKLDYWYFIDNKIRKKYTFNGKKEHYKLVIGVGGSNNPYWQTYSNRSDESTVLAGDEKAVDITLNDYFAISHMLKMRGLYLYNKKLGRAVLKTKNEKN